MILCCRRRKDFISYYFFSYVHRWMREKRLDVYAKVIFFCFKQELPLDRSRSPRQNARGLLRARAKNSHTSHVRVLRHGKGPRFRAVGMR